MAADVKDKILDRPRAKEWMKWRPDVPSADEMRKRLNAENTSDEELLLRWIVGKEDIDAMRANPRPLEYLNSEQPLVNLLQELSKRASSRQIHVQTPAFSVTMERRS
jgi:oxaloacetate decarboxylase alpha subunit